MENLILNSGTAWALGGAAIAASLGGVGSALGTSYVGQASTGIVAENPELGSKAMILTALPGTQSLYGLVGGYLVLQLPIFEVSYEQGFAIFLASLPLAITALFSGIAQGKIAAGGANIIAKNPNALSSAITLSVLVETVAIFGFLVSFLSFNAIKAVLAS